MTFRNLSFRTKPHRASCTLLFGDIPNLPIVSVFGAVTNKGTYAMLT